MKTLKKLLYLVLVSVFFFTCSQKETQLEPKRTVIAGVVKNFSDDASVVIIYFNNPLTDKWQFAQNLIESNGYFHAEHDYAFAQNVMMLAGNKHIRLFVHPGDSIFITVDADENFDNAVTFSGDNAKLNKEFSLWTKYSYPIFNKNIHLNSNSPEELLASLKREFDKAQDSINAYSERENMSDFLKHWAYMDRKFLTVNSLMSYYMQNRNKETTWDIFTDSIFDVFNQNNFQTHIFSTHLDVCTDVLIQSDTEISHLLSEKKYIPATRLFIEKLHEKAPKGVVRDMMLFKFLRYWIINEIPEIYDFIPEIKSSFSQNFFNRELEKLIKKIGQTQKLSETESQLRGILYLADNEIEELPDVKLLNYLAEKSKGKLLYIDVWATWCGPCIREFQVTPDLHKHFEDKEVVFINLCLDSPCDAWKPAIEKHSISGENYFLSTNASNLFMADNNLSGYPSYLIIDKNREIHYKVPRPSQLEDAIQKIELCLK